jgi:hypothetical protein
VSVPLYYGEWLKTGEGTTYSVSGIGFLESAWNRDKRVRRSGSTSCDGYLSTGDVELFKQIVRISYVL